MKKLLLITVAVTIISSYLRANEDKDRGHLASIKEKILTTTESAEPNTSEEKNSVHQAEAQPQWKQCFQNFKQGETYPIATAIFVGLSTGAISGVIEKKGPSIWLLVWIIESGIRPAIITDLQNNMNQDNIQFKKRIYARICVVFFLGSLFIF